MFRLCLTDGCRNVVVQVARGASLVEVAALFIYSRYEHADS